MVLIFICTSSWHFRFRVYAPQWRRGRTNPAARQSACPALRPIWDGASFASPLTRSFLHPLDHRVDSVGLAAVADLRPTPHAFRIDDPVLRNGKTIQQRPAADGIVHVVDTEVNIAAGHYPSITVL